MSQFIYVPAEVRGYDPVHGAQMNEDPIVKVVVHDPHYLAVCERASAARLAAKTTPIIFFEQTPV